MKYLTRVMIFISGALLGSAAAPWTLPKLAELTDKTVYRPGYRVPELKVDLSSGKGGQEVMMWKTVIPPATNHNAGLTLHRHNYARTLIPITDGVLQRCDADGTKTDYVLTPGKPVALPADTPEGFHTDENFGSKPIEVVVVQFNQASTPLYSPLTEGEIKASFGKMKP